MVVIREPTMEGRNYIYCSNFGKYLLLLMDDFERLAQAYLQRVYIMMSPDFYYHHHHRTSLSSAKRLRALVL